MLFHRLRSKNIIQVEGKIEHDLVYRYHMSPQYLMYIDHCDPEEKETAICGESIQGNTKIGDEVRVLDGKGNTLAYAKIKEITVRGREREETCAGDKKVIIMTDRLKDEISQQAQMLAIKEIEE